MKGAVAAGHPLTAEAGARILAEGGNAVDACIAAAFVSWVAESPLTGPGGGGFMLVHRARDGIDSLLDFFVAVPGNGLPSSARGEMLAVDVAFDERTTQVFHIGPAAVAVPGMPAGLATAHRRYANLPWAELIAPAVELARAGVPLNAGQAFLHEMLDVILRSDPEGRRIYGGDSALGEKERVVMPDLAETLEWLAAEGADVFYRGELARRLSTAVREGGGAVTEADLAGYRVIRRRPVRAAYRRTELVSNPPPSSGGLLIAFALRVLDRLGPPAPLGSAEGIARVVEAMREAARLRGPGFVGDLYRGGAARRLLAEERVEAAAASVRAALRARAPEPAGVPSTTHISVVDARGNAASLSASTGCGSGVIVPGTGMQMNNMLGEPDLNPSGQSDAAGREADQHDGALHPARRRPAAARRGKRGLDSPPRGHPPDRPAGGRRRSQRRGGDPRPSCPSRRRRAAPRRRCRGLGRRWPGGGRICRQPLDGAQPLLRWRLGGRPACRRGARGGRRPAARRRRRRGRHMTIHVRRAAPGDAAALVELARAVGAEPEGWLITNGEWRTQSEERRYLRAVRRHSHAAVFVAETADAIVGRISLARDAHPASEHVADLGLMVAEPFRRRGVGRALMDAAEAWAREVGVLKLELHVFPYNEAAIALYEGLGYEREGYRRDHYRRSDGFVDAILMAKVIR